jgi:hypothetical protein
MGSQHAGGTTEAGASSPPAEIELFGFRPTAARVRVVHRSSGWRLGHAALYLLLCWGAILLVMWVPPHIPWALAAFLLGIFFAVKYIRERYTLLELDGTCPRCAAPVRQDQPGRLGLPHRLYCSNCHQPLLLRVHVDPQGARASAA